MSDITVILCEEKTALDEIGQNVAICQKKNEVFAKMSQIHQSEFYKAAQIGLTPTFKLEMHEFDYHGENLVSVEGRMYKIYRTYTRNDETIELYCMCATGIEMR